MFYCLLVEIVSCKMLKIKVVTFSSCVTFYSKWQVKTFVKKNRVVIMRENFFLLLDSVKEKKSPFIQIQRRFKYNRTYFCRPGKCVVKLLKRDRNTISSLSTGVCILQQIVSRMHYFVSSVTVLFIKQEFKLLIYTVIVLCIYLLIYS